MLVETYTKILSYLGVPSTTPPGFPRPPSSYAGSSTNGSFGGGGDRGAAGLSPALTDVVLKIDTRLTVRPLLFLNDVIPELCAQLTFILFTSLYFRN